MQSEPEGRKVQMEKGWAAEVLARRFDSLSRALAFVEQEEVDSGIIVSRGAAVRFWHLTFQEFLAARAIAGLSEQDQRQLLLVENRIYRPEWREMALLLAGVLLVKQGPAKVDGLIAAVLEKLGSRATLAAKARCAGLLGAMVNDLKPLDYQPSDARYRQLMNDVLEIFDLEKAESVAFSERLEAAEALGQAGDPRLGQDNWVRIGKFEIGRYPVTVAEYKIFVENDGYLNKRWWKEGGYGSRKEPDKWTQKLEHPNRPVTDVTWYEAAAYSAWAGARLPTDAEWRRAERGENRRDYPWGNERLDPTRANFRENGPGHATPVGLYPAGATPEGVQDMAGNVWEWVQDRFEQGKEERVLLGGSWYHYGTDRRYGHRLRSGPGKRILYIGFRLARECKK